MSQFDRSPVRRLVAQVIRGRTVTDSFDDEGEYPWWNPTALTENLEIGEPKRRVSADSVRRGVFPLAPAGCTAFAFIGSVGRCALLTEPGVVNEQLVCLVPNEQCEPRFLVYAMRALGPSLDALAFHTVIRYLPLEALWSFRVPTPSLPVQRAIADYLDAETARIDALIEKKKRIVELLKEKLFTITKVRMAHLAELYGSIQLRYLVRCLDGRRVPLSSEERAIRSGPYPYFGASSVVDWIDDYLFDETLVLLGEDGAQLGDPRYPIAQMVQGRVWVNNHAHVLRPTKVDPLFLTYFLNTFDRTLHISGGLREKITQDDMNRIPVPDVPQENQVREVEFLESLHSQVQNLSGRLLDQISLLQERRQALITTAVTGELEIQGAAA